MITESFFKVLLVAEHITSRDLLRDFYHDQLSNTTLFRQREALDG